MKIAVYLLLLSCLTCLTGCFEIVEQLFLKADGSGDFQLVLNLSKSKTRLNSISKMKTLNGHTVPTKDEIKYRLADIEKTVSKTAGISKVKTSIDFDNYIASISCSFKTVGNINEAVKNVYLKENAGKKSAGKDLRLPPWFF
jgi:hypothetical protein